MRLKHNARYIDLETFLEVAGDGLAEKGKEILRRMRAKGSRFTPEEGSDAIIEGIKRWRKITEDKLKKQE